MFSRHFMIAFFFTLLYNTDWYPGVAQLVGRLLWELEHGIGSTSPNVAYSLLSSQLPLIASVESPAKLW